MNAEFFTGSLGLILLTTIVVASRILPQEKWQILAAIPVSPDGQGGYRGVNLTWYGFISACAYTLSAALFWVMLRSVSAPPAPVVISAFLLLGICMPSARIIARLVEKKKATFTVGGAVFVGAITAPPIAFGIKEIYGSSFDPVTVLSASAIAYAFGEGFGRLACISFGCCYGAPLKNLPEPAAKFFTPFATRFTGSLKKACYEGEFESEPTVPIATMTALINTTAGLVGLWFFLNGYQLFALMTAIGITQLWRFASEFLRADYRGDGSVSAYQWMALATFPYLALWFYFLGSATIILPDINAGLSALWDVKTVMALELLWVISFLYTGMSRVTGSEVRFFVRRDQT